MLQDGIISDYVIAVGDTETVVFRTRLCSREVAKTLSSECSILA